MKPKYSPILKVQAMEICEARNRMSLVLLTLSILQLFQWGLDGHDPTFSIPENQFRKKWEMKDFFRISEHKWTHFEKKIWNSIYESLQNFLITRISEWSLDGRNPTRDFQEKTSQKNGNENPQIHEKRVRTFHVQRTRPRKRSIRASSCVINTTTFQLNTGWLRFNKSSR